MNGRVGPLVVAGKTGDLKEVILKHLLAITIALLPSAALAEQFTPQQMLDVMTNSPSNRDVRVHDSFPPFLMSAPPYQCNMLETAQGRACMGAK